MVFKFFKGIVDTIKEGIEEGKAELAQEKAEKEQEASDNAARLADISDEEKFYTALGAPFRKLFVSEEPYFLGSMAVPDAKRDEVAKYLRRDFDVTDRRTLLEMLIRAQASVFGITAIERAAENEDEFALLLDAARAVGFNTDLTDEDVVLEALMQWLLDFIERPDAEKLAEWEGFRDAINSEILPDGLEVGETALARIALWMARFSYAASVSAGLGYVSRGEAISLLEPLVRIGQPRISDWQEYGALYLAGEKEDGTNNAIGRKVMASMVAGLGKRPDGFWTSIPWRR